MNKLLSIKIFYVIFVVALIVFFWKKGLPVSTIQKHASNFYDTLGEFRINCSDLKFINAENTLQDVISKKKYSDIIIFKVSQYHCGRCIDSTLNVINIKKHKYLSQKKSRKLEFPLAFLVDNNTSEKELLFLTERGVSRKNILKGNLNFENKFSNLFVLDRPYLFLVTESGLIKDLIVPSYSNTMLISDFLDKNLRKI